AEGAVRLGHADNGDACRVMGVPVAVRVDGALEAGDELVGAAVDGPAACGVPLPPGDADGKDVRARGDAARADHDPRELGAVLLELACIAGTRLGIRVRVARDDVVA